MRSLHASGRNPFRQAYEQRGGAHPSSDHTSIAPDRVTPVKPLAGPRVHDKLGRWPERQLGTRGQPPAPTSWVFWEPNPFPPLDERSWEIAWTVIRHPGQRPRSTGIGPVLLSSADDSRVARLDATRRDSPTHGPAHVIQHVNQCSIQWQPLAEKRCG